MLNKSANQQKEHALAAIERLNVPYFITDFTWSTVDSFEPPGSDDMHGHFMDGKTVRSTTVRSTCGLIIASIRDCRIQR
jgi:hypothetical protein